MVKIAPLKVVTIGSVVVIGNAGPGGSDVSTVTVTGTVPSPEAGPAVAVTSTVNVACSPTTLPI